VRNAQDRFSYRFFWNLLVDPRLAFLDGGGEMGARMRAFDWSRTPLGEPAGWPQPLKTLVGLMLASEQPMFMAWGQGQTWLYNTAFIPIMGTKHPERLGRHALDEVWKEAYMELEPLFARVFAGEPVHMQDFGLMLDRDGRLEEAHFAFSYTPVRDDAGRVAGLFGACIEITERVLADRRRAAEQERQRRMFEQAPGFMCILRGPQHVFEFVNNEHKKLFNSADWVGKPMREAFPELEGQGYIELLDQVYASGHRYVARSAPVRYRRSVTGPAEERLLDFIYEPMHDDAGAVTGIFCEGFDVTEARRAEQALRDSEARLREADRRKDVFLATLAHELRNPLAPIRQAVRIAKAPDRTTAQLEWAHEVIERQSAHMALLLDDLLDMSRITHGQLTLRTTRIALESVVDSAIETARPLLDARKHVLERAMPEPPLVIEADAMRLAQVVSNLLTNAAKYTDPGGRIELGARCDGSTLRIRVRDSGIGIDAQTLPRLFQTFSQAHDALERAQGGLGIGLALVKGLVELHGGTVEAHSAGRGRGSEFVVTLPHAVVLGEAPAAAAPAAFGPLRSVRRRILVVDDNVDAGESLKLLLELDGHEVRLANDGEQAISAVAVAAPDVVFLDIGMPTLNGYEAARRIRALPSGKAMKLIALTGWGQPGDRERAMEAGFDVHLTKPVDHAKVRELLQQT
jgi:PAS domain S-box-containing protein